MPGCDLTIKRPGRRPCQNSRDDGQFGLDVACDLEESAPGLAVSHRNHDVGGVDGRTRSTLLPML
jgi:hypothetical protein